MSEETIVRQNLMTREGYAPYCCECPSMIRLVFKGDQFECIQCRSETQFPDEFIERYKEKWGKP